MHLEALRALQTPVGQAALLAAGEAQPKEPDFLPLVQQLARRFPEAVARAAVEQAILRRRAREKFPRAGVMYFERSALEQATPEAVAAHRARRFQGSPMVFDLGCGLGADAMALAAMAPVVAVDRDSLRLALLRANAEALGRQGQIHLIRADLHALPLQFPPGSAAFFDPERRDDGRRIHRVQDYHPPLSLLNVWLPLLSGLAVKVSPAVRRAELEGLDCEREFISLRGSLKEATLWFGRFKSADQRATLLPGPHTLTGPEGPPLPIEPPRRYIYEPDPAVLRAGLVHKLGAHIGAAQIDPTIAILTCDRLINTPFARAYRLVEALPFGLKRLRRALRQRDIGQATLKKRGSPVDVDVFLRKLRLSGEGQATVLLTRAAGKRVALILEPLTGPESDERPS